MQLDNDFLKRWEQIVSDVDKDHVPIECVKKVVFRHKASRQKTINLRHLKKQRLNMDEINSVVERYLRDNEEDIVGMEFVLDVEAVAELLQPETDKLLKGM